MTKPTISIAVATSQRLNFSGLIDYQELFRYLVVSGVAFLIDFGLLLLLVHGFDVAYPAAAAFAFLAGLAFAYVASIRWAFSQRALTNWQFELLVFTAIGIVGLLLTEAVLYCGVTILGLPVAIAKIISAGFVFSTNFLLRKHFLFTICR